MEIFTSIASSIAENITGRLFDAVDPRLGYLLHYNEIIEALKKQAKKLTTTRESIDVKVEVAKRNRETILPDVQNWMSEVDNISAEVEKFLEDEVKANRRCLGGLCINFRSSYKFGKEAKKQTLAISNQLQVAEKFDKVSCPAPPPGIIISSSKAFSDAFKSRQSIMKQIMEALINQNVSAIGICGMGGVGKTTLVKKFGIQAKEGKLFDEVVIAVVSQTPNILKIQGDMANMLGLKFSGDSESTRAPELWDRIKKEKRILIILDDVWERIELDDIGIPLGTDHEGCKLLLTSRRKTVCDQMECQKIFVVGTLSKQEAWVLFSELAGPDIENSNINPIAREITAKCGGLPIAIVTIARALKNKSKFVWMDAMQQLRKSTPTNIEGVHKNVITSLELSYSYLESEAKSLFLFCCLFPEDFDIPIEILVRYGTGLRWFKGLDTMDEIRVRTHATVSTLISSFLLIGDDDLDLDEGHVKMHDVVRDVAQVIAPKYKHIFIVKAGISLQEWPSRETYEDLTSISLMSNDIQNVPGGLKCPNLESLLLQENSKLSIPQNFFEGIENLKVLDLSKTQILTLPESFSFLGNLRTLCLRNCKLGDISRIGQLCNLEILDFCDSNITEIPTSFSQLSNLKLLDMDCENLTLISRGVMPCFRKLEELSMMSFTDWDSEGEGDSGRNVKVSELQDMSRLTSLEIGIPNPNIIPNDMASFQNLASFFVSIGIGYGFEPKDKRVMALSGLSISKIFDSWIKSLLGKTETLFLSEICGLENTLHDLLKELSSNLKSLDIQSCEIKYILNTLESAPKLTFQKLENLRISENPKLVEICHGQPPAQSFSELKKLDVYNCNSMLNIVTNHLLQRFQNLETLEVWNCESAIYIFDCEGLKTANEGTKLLSSLKYLRCSNLPEIMHIWKGETDHFVNLCNLKTVVLIGCQKLIKLFSPALLQSLICLERLSIINCRNLEEIFGKKEVEDEEKGIVTWRKHHTTTYPSLVNLTYLHIKDCDKLRTLFTPSMVKNLVKLNRFVIYRCLAIKEIITNEEVEKETSRIERIVFPSLTYLELGRLENFTCFSSGSYCIEFPVLEEVWIYVCPNMESFGKGEQLTPKLKKVQTYMNPETLASGYEEFWMGNLNATVQQLFKEQKMRKNKKRDANQPGAGGVDLTACGSEN